MADVDSKIGNDGSRRVAAKPTMSVPHAVFEFPLALADTTDYLTPDDKLFVLAHLGVPEIDPSEWKLEIAGLVEKPLIFSLDDLDRYPTRKVKAVHHCAGNPMEPTVPTRTIANVEWSGVLLREILSEVAVKESCTHLWAFGLDFGSFSGIEQEHYVKDVPLPYVMNADVLIATELNGKPLSEKHGFPARLVVPGFYGSNSVKWLCRIELAEFRTKSLFTTRLYNDPDPETGNPNPVWRIEPESIIVYPPTDSTVTDTLVKITGWAWSFAEVESAQISVDGGETWAPAELEPRDGLSWQRFTYSWVPGSTGEYQICCRATDADGKSQPIESARNSVHIVNIKVVRL